MTDERDVMRDRIESLQAERAALVAENEKLREELRQTTIPLYGMLDVWMALGLDSQGFQPYYDEHGYALTWSNLLGCVRGPQMPCAEPMDGGTDWCVFEEGHFGPHWASSDVGVPNDLLPRVRRADGR